MYRDGKGPNVKDIQRAMFNSFRCSPSYWKCWKGGEVAKEMVRGTAENGYSCLSTFSYMFETLNVGSSYFIMVNKDSHRFTYYLLTFGACIKGFAHMRKVIAVDGTHLHGKYEGALLSVVAQDTENHVYPIVFCVVDKENDASWTFFFEKLKEIVVDEPDLCFIFDRHKSIANGIVNVYNHAHYGYCMRHLGENLYLYYNAAKAYSLEEFDNNFVEFKKKFSVVAIILEYDIGFEKWSRAHFPGNRYDVMTTNIAESPNPMLIDEREYPVALIFNSIAKRFRELSRERWLENESSTSSPSNFQGVAKFELLRKLRQSEENRDLLMTFLKKAEEQRNHLKVLLKDVEGDRDQLKERLILAEEKEKCLKTVLCGLFLVFAF
ncbi:uncharacterized protein LOC125840658 [Solanum verrucosum]|uniref:uncharacterized protein LOC125840658 n=1 Tax=Solanum verrucosum TaxID=315347 RepID=UPI0020D1D28B|nr:uncharacterized protein LOC125840658 [Solanum verrucosum]